MPKVYVAEIVNEGAKLAQFFTERYGSLGEVVPLVSGWRGGTTQDIVDAVIETMKGVEANDCIAATANHLVFAIAAGEMGGYFDGIRIATYDVGKQLPTVTELGWDISSFETLAEAAYG